MRVLRVLGTMVFILVLTVVLVLGCRCEVSAKGQAVEVEEELWGHFFESIPPDSEKVLPEGALDNAESFGSAVKEMSGAEFLIEKIVEVLGIELDSALKLACGICAILVLGAVFSSAGASIGNGALGAAVRFCSSGALFVTVISAQYSHFEAIEQFFSSVSSLMEAMVPITASVWAMGGNVSTAATGSASFYLALGICNKLFAKSIIPVATIMSILGLCDAMSDEMRTGRLLAAIKRIYGFFLALVMTVLLSSMSAQTAVSSASDSATARTARLVSGSVIPVLGGGVGETLRTVAGGVAYLKSILGVGGIILIFLLILPVGLSVLLTRFVFLVTGGLADILGCPAEARLLENLGEVYGCMLAVISGVAITFILALCIFTQTVVAVA